MLRGIAKALFVSRAWIVSIAFLVAVWAVVKSSKPFQDCVNEQHHYAATEQFEKSISSLSIAFDIYRVCLGHFTHDNAEAIIAAFTILLALSTIFLWVATRDLVSGAEKTAQWQLRAYVLVEGAELSIHPQGIGGWMAQITINNFGQTPAYKIAIKVEKRIAAAIAPDMVLKFSNAAIERGESTLGPGSFMTLTVDFNEVPRKWADWVRLREQNTKGYVWGRIDYIDAFSEPRWTTFQMIHHFAQIHQFVYCLRGNATEFRLRNSPNAVPRK